MEPRSQVDLPPGAGEPFTVFVNGIEQKSGVDFTQVGRSLVFTGELRQEGRLGFWRWTSIFLGVAGTYRRNDTVDLVYTVSGRRVVASLTAKPAGPPG